MTNSTRRRFVGYCSAAAVAALITGSLSIPSTAHADALAPIDETTGVTVSAIVRQFGGVGVSFDRATSRFTVRVPRGVNSAALVSALGPEAGRVRVEPSQFGSATLGSLLKKLQEPASDTTMKSYSYGYYYDAVSDTVAVETTAPKQVFAAAYDGPDSTLTVSHVTDAARASRQDDGPPHKGGADIMGAGERCSSGFTVAKGGRRYMVTAGHCFVNGTAVRDASNVHAFGTVSGRTQFPAFDMELIGGSTYSRDIYTGGSTGVRYAVESAADPSLTGSYCHSGRTSFEHCGDDPVSLESSFCDQAGCTDDLVAYRGVTIQPGDSGSPFYAKFNDPDRVKIRGENIAYSGSTSYAEKWSAVTSHLGVSIVTTPLP